MTSTPAMIDPHRHTVVEKAALAQRHGVPVEVVRCICSSCKAVLAERRPPQLIVEVAQPDLPLDGLNLTGAEVIATPVHAGRLLGSIRKMLAGRALPADWWGGGATRPSGLLNVRSRRGRT